MTSLVIILLCALATYLCFSIVRLRYELEKINKYLFELEANKPSIYSGRFR